MKKTLLAASIAAALTHQIAFAGNEGMIVTATRVSELENLAASVTTITAEEIAQSAARTLPELLASEVGVNTTSLYSHGSRASIDLRGFGEASTQNTLILLDGRRLNDIDISSVNFAAIPFENIERIEIIRGSGAVLYGDGATGGVINIVTKNPRNAKNYSKLDLTMGSYDYREINAFTSYSNKDFGLTANINSQENDGYRDHNSFDQNSAQVDLRIPVSAGEIYAKLGAFQQNIELPGVRTVDPTIAVNELSSNRKGTSTPNDWADEYTEYITLGYSADLNANDSLVVDAGYRRKHQRSQFDYGFGYGAYAETAVETLSLTPRLTLARELAGQPMDVLLGLDLYAYDYESSRSDFKRNVGQASHKLDVAQKSIALYGQMTVALTEETSLTAGARVQNVRQKARDAFDSSAPGAFGNEAPDFTESDTEESYELGIKHQFSNSWSAYGRVGQKARFGTVDELFEFNGSFVQVFSELKPQISRDVEVGVNFENDWLQSTLSIFHQELTDEIHFDPVTFQNVNLDDTERDGVELSANAKLNELLTIKGGYTYLSAEFTDGLNGGNNIPLVAEHTYSLSFLATLPHAVSAAINWNYVSASYFANDPSNTFGQRIPSYQTVDLKLSKQIEALELALQVNNVFDEEYFNFGVNSTATAGRFNAYALPERNAYLTASYTFE
ncbi:MAG: TonB-dependent receptor [Cycloclasticus sp.]